MCKERDNWISSHCWQNTSAPVTANSTRMSMETAMAIVSGGMPSWAKRIISAAVPPPGTGGVAMDRTTTENTAIASQDTEIVSPEISAMHNVSTKYSSAVAGMNRTCPRGAAKLETFSATPSFFGCALHDQRKGGGCGSGDQAHEKGGQQLFGQHKRRHFIAQAQQKIDAHAEYAAENDQHKRFIGTGQLRNAAADDQIKKAEEDHNGHIGTDTLHNDLEQAVGLLHKSGKSRNLSTQNQHGKPHQNGHKRDLQKVAGGKRSDHTVWNKIQHHGQQIRKLAAELGTDGDGEQRGNQHAVAEHQHKGQEQDPAKHCFADLSERSHVADSQNAGDQGEKTRTLATAVSRPPRVENRGCSSCSDNCAPSCGAQSENRLPRSSADATAASK